MESQVLDAGNRYRGGLAEAAGLYMPGSAGGLIEQFTTAFVWPESKYRGNHSLIDRIALAAQFLDRSMTKTATSIC